MVAGKINNQNYLLSGFLASSGFQLSFADDGVPWLNAFEVKNNLSIGEIDIITGDIFDLKNQKRMGQFIDSQTKFIFKQNRQSLEINYCFRRVIVLNKENLPKASVICASNDTLRVCL